MASVVGLLGSCLPEVSLDGRACVCEGDVCSCSEGYVCDRPRDICVAAVESCDPPCSEGDVCTEGACVTPACAPVCERGYACRAGACEPSVFVRATATAATTERSALSLAIPPQVEPGDLALVVVFARLATDATHPAGWDVIETDAGSCGGWRVFHLTRLVDGTEQSFDETFSDAQQITAAFVAYGGVDPSNPIAATSGVRLAAGEDQEVPPWVAPSVTTIVPGARIVSAMTDLSGGPFRAPPATEPRVDAGTIFFFDALQATAGASPEHSVEGRVDGCGTAITWALAPAP